MERKWTLARRLRRDATDAERHLWRRLRRSQLAGWKFRRQHPIAGYIVDFVCIPGGLVVELDGGQHAENVEADVERTRRLSRAGYRVLRFWNDEVLREVDAVCARLLHALELGPPWRYNHLDRFSQL